ncbi:MAG: SDR family NAD(P)-dependent oxidoreductase [Cytophagales bacterium]|nr:MAG: SDR family NAD(P)-dependent oxidoreductase [Cytophagales bacterium]
MQKIALITGATSGIGKATAEIFAQHNIHIILCGRRQERLDEMARQLGKSVKTLTLTFDVRDRDEVFKQIERLPEAWKNIDILVNNAGNAHGLAPTDKADLADWEAMIDINVKGLMYVSKAVIPQMVERKTGHIINLGSIAGKEVYANGNAYCASKYAVDALNTGMRLDLVQYGIKVTAINPGLVETEFSLVRFKGDEEKAKNVYKGITPLTAADVAEVIYFAVSRPAHVNIADVIVFPTAQASATTVIRQG